jgi:hypothetical protein
MSDVLERVNAGELTLCEDIAGYGEENYVPRENATRKLLQLAKLGQAALDAISKRKRAYHTSYLCAHITHPIDDENCPNCEWREFCKLRKEMG